MCIDQWINPLEKGIDHWSRPIIYHKIIPWTIVQFGCAGYRGDMNNPNHEKPRRQNKRPSPRQLQRRGKFPLTLVYESGTQTSSLDEAIVEEALSGTVMVMDAGNCFNPLRLTRHIRQQTLQIYQVLERIRVARAFTCFQVVALLEQTRDPRGTVYLLRPLATFRDEMAPDYERMRLLRAVDQHIARLQDTAPVTVMIKERHLQEELLLDWLSVVQARADAVVSPNLVGPPRLATLI
jgi:hypothetical protein